jgi:hypothetical protein
MQRYGGADSGEQVHSAAIADFSSVVVAAAGWMNFPNLVPVLAKRQDNYVGRTSH